MLSLLLLPVVKADTTFSDQGNMLIMGYSTTVEVTGETSIGATTPGTTLSLSTNVSEVHGADNITDVTLTCWGSTSSEGALDSWDHYTNSSGLVTNLNITTNSYDFKIALNSKSERGLWTCRINATDFLSATDSMDTGFTMNTRVGISLDHSSCTASGKPGTKDLALTNCAPVTITNDGNVNINVTVTGTNLTGQTYPSWVIPVGNLGHNSTNNAPGTALSESDVQILGDWARGTYPTALTSTQYWFISLPTPLSVQNYTGTVTYIASAS
jgi:hypothetical protein